MTYQELFANHKAKMNAREAKEKEIRARIYALKNKIEWNEKQMKKLWDNCPSWIEDIVFPFLAEVNKLLPDLVIKGEKITFGMNCETPVHATKNGETVFFSHLEPGADGLLYHTQKIIRSHPYGNDYETKPVESVEQYAAYIKNCIESEREIPAF